ncbi:uncharacterized protein B0H64DRAFT_415827 [Chaetomium fimeti]|uniref:Uncharacterized protein n=1 Tax=Chaetomium fimeti TaxID=1854472 RepID=A0AAE0LVW1_9PEZI|nr:hypothetical protein B0H64DRAFT_415827 [Chaetomium fimeti]
MDADYIPLGPGPMPKIPKLPKAPKKRPKKQRPPPLAQETPEPDRFVDPAFADTPYPFASPPDEPSAVPPPLPVSPPSPLVDHAPEADPGIWDLGTDTPPQHAVRRAPARPGNVYCETCFRDDLARWLRIRDGVVRVLHLLGGDTALYELRALSLEAEEAELCLTEEYQGSRLSGSGLRSPPPPAYISSSSESESEEEGPNKGSVAAKKIIVMSDHGQSWEAPHFNEYPSDIVGLVLLRILAERPTSGLQQAQREEVNQLLEELRQDVGVGPRFFQAMTTVGKSMVVRWRTKGLPKDSPGQQNNRGKIGHWWWEFDAALQTAHEEVVSVETHLPSLFVSTLAAKARDASLGVLAAKEAATAQKHEDSHHDDTRRQAAPFAELEKAFGMAIPSNVFLKSVGNKLALAKQQLEQHTTEQPTTTTSKQKRNADPDPHSPTPSPKRRKPNPSTSPTLPTSTSTSPPPPPPPPSETPPAIPLPCTYCSESTASHRHRARHARPWGADSAIDLDRRPITSTTATQPWTRPLAWAFPRLPPPAAARIRTAEDWLRLVAGSRRVRVGEVLPPLGGDGEGGEDGGNGGDGGDGDGSRGGEAVVRFMVDGTGGKTRVVLVRVRGVFEVLLGLGGGVGAGGRQGGGFGGGRGRGSGSQVRFAPAPVMVRETTGAVMGAARSVGMWENWRGGRLEGSRFV